MERKEKKWTDEEILQEMQAHQEAAECYGFVQVIGKQMNRWLDLIHRLQGENKNLASSFQSKNAKIKNLNTEKEALQNELNFQNGKPHYRYVIWNAKKNKRQFPSICELTESGAYTKLFQKIGWDSAKYRFEVRRIKVDGVEVE